MNYGDAMLPPVHGLVDPQGHLVEADPRLEELNGWAGGAIGQPLAVPQIARLARLAQRLGILVSRAVIAADPHGDVELWVRAEPSPAGVRLALTGWRTRSAWAAEPAAAQQREAAFVTQEGEWAWETDAALRLTFATTSAGPRFGFDPAAVLGQPLTRLFALGEDDSGDVPLLGALALRQQFDGQVATVRASGRKMRLSASPRVDSSGAFAGLIGAATAEHDDGEPEPTLAPPPSALPALGGDDFARRLDRALRAPLDRIIANADSIHARSDGPIRQDYVDYAADISTAARHLVDLVDDLTDLHFIERPGFTAAAEPIDLADVARRAAGLLQVRAAEQGVRIDKPAVDEALPALGEFRRALQVMVKPRRQRRPLFAGGRDGLAADGGRWQRRGDHRRRPGQGHRRRGPGADIRQVRAGRSARAGRQWPGPVHLAPVGASDGGRRDRRLGAGPGCPLPVPPAAAAGCGGHGVKKTPLPGVKFTLGSHYPHA